MPDVSMPAEAAALPVPDDELIRRVTGTPDHTWFFWSGRESVRELERALVVAGRALNSFKSILDFGCGCGRMLLWMESAGSSGDVHGTDIDPEAIAWCRAHIPYVTAGLNGADPPLSYPDEAFDLVFNHSVFTHIDEARQDAWLTELQRVTRPGGLLVLSTHGETALSIGPSHIRERLEREGIVFLDDAHPPDFPLPRWYQATYHAPWYVFEHWGRWFEILAYLPAAALGLQDHVVLRRTVPHSTPLTPLAARPPSAAEGSLIAALAHTHSNRDHPGRAATRLGAAGRLGRRLILRALRPYVAHEDAFDLHVATAVDRVAQTTADQARRLDAVERNINTAQTDSRSSNAL
jgi:SAM-dependent methyltransferase